MLFFQSVAIVSYFALICLAYDAGVTPALKRRRERAERQRSFMREQESVTFVRECLLREDKHENENGRCFEIYYSCCERFVLCY